MSNPSVIRVRGRLTDDRHVELDEPVPQGAGAAADVVVEIATPADAAQALIDYIDSLPPGTRSDEQIDADLDAQRDGWGPTR